MSDHCSTCSAPLVWITRDGQPVQVCGKPACPGHRSLLDERAA